MSDLAPSEDPIARQGLQLPSRAVLISIAIHALIVAALLFLLPLLPHRADSEAERPIAITLVTAPAEDPAEAAKSAAEAARAAAQALAAEAAAQAVATAAKPAPPAPPPTMQALPYDPSFNPFATAQPAQESESAPANAPAAQPSDAGPVEPAQDGGDGIDQLGDGPGNPGGMAGQPQPGNPDGDPKLHPQFLRIQLRGYVNAIYSNQLHSFLQRLITCGVVPVPASDPNLSVEADVTFNPAGMLQSARLSNEAQYPGNPAYQKAAQELMGALGRPSCSFIRLPVIAYPAWQAVHLSFYQHIQGH